MSINLSHLKQQAADIRQWATDRNIIGGGTAAQQFLKQMEEVGELFVAAENNDRSQVLDGIGDTFVVLTIISALLEADMDKIVDESDESVWVPVLSMEIWGGVAGYIARRNVKDFSTMASCIVDALDQLAMEFGSTLEGCVALAWDEIKDRKGILWQGVFIKSDDPRYDAICAEVEASRVNV